MAAKRFATLAQWLNWQETLHHSKIDLGLARIAAVAQALIDMPPDFPVITVAGTNGKGSVCTYLNATLMAAGHKTGMFTSPHVQRYNERVQIDGIPATDAELMRVFERIDDARADTTITYFEFSALAALALFNDACVDCAILEVGMGGRLDAVNIVDADVAVITNIGLDHQQWLGTDREQIAHEKAGIMRPGVPVLCGDRDPPARLQQDARAIGAPVLLLGRDFHATAQADTWTYASEGLALPGLLRPALPGVVQIDNAALAIAALKALGERLPVAVGHIQKGLRSARLPGRIQALGNKPTWILDVSHNPDSARVLSAWLSDTPCTGRTHLVLGMLADKDAEGVAAELAAVTDAWYLATLSGDRGLSAAVLRERVGAYSGGKTITIHESVKAACEAAGHAAHADDRIVVCGSFHTVGEAMALGL